MIKKNIKKIKNNFVNENKDIQKSVNLFENKAKYLVLGLRHNLKLSLNRDSSFIKGFYIDIDLRSMKSLSK